MYRIFHLPSAGHLPQNVLSGNIGQVKCTLFPDGEHNLFLGKSIRGADAVLVGSTHDDNATLELYDAACAAVKYGAKRLTLLIPYFGYSTQERACQGADAEWLEAVPAKSRARLFSSIPQAAQGNRVILFDLHAEGLPHYFERNITAHHLYGKKLVIKTALELGKQKPLVFASADAGRAKWVKSLAKDAGVESAFALKDRLSGSETELTGVFGNVQDKVVVLYDDMIRTGGSVLDAGLAYRNMGAERLHLIASHGVLPGNSIHRLADSGLFDSATFTNSHPRALLAKLARPEFVNIIDMMPTADQLLQELHHEPG